MKLKLDETIETERLILERSHLKHAAHIYQSYATNPEVTKYLSWKTHEHVDETRDFLKKCDVEWKTGVGCPYVIFEKSDPSNMIGMIHPRLTIHGVHFGYVLRESAWGKGYSSEALTELVARSLNDPEIFRIYAYCDAEHTASERVMQKAGLSKEADLKRYIIHPNISPDPRDCVMYSQTK